MEELSTLLLPFAPGASAAQMLRITPLIRERIRLLRDVQTVADFFLEDELKPYDSAELIPKKGDASLAKKVLERAAEVLATAGFTHDGLEHALRGRGIDTVLIAGTKTNVCCEATARDAMMLDFKVAMVCDCCAALSDQEHVASLETMLQQFGDVLTTEDVFARLDGGSSLQVSDSRPAANHLAKSVTGASR